MDPTALRNRLVVASSLWRQATSDPLPRMPAGDPATQIEAFELKLVDKLGEGATPDTAREIADRTWDLVHDRPDADPVKQRVTALHDELAKLARPGI
jgi:hypothetical protein